MAVPSYDKIMYPLLELAKDGQEKNINSLLESLADILNLSNEDRTERMPNKNKHRTKFQYRAAWAKTYLNKAGLISNTGRSKFIITDAGVKVVNDKFITYLDSKYLMKFKSFAEFISRDKAQDTKESNTEIEGQAPEEKLQNVFGTLNNTLVSDLLDTLKDCSPSHFEKIVIDVLLAMGYGGSAEDAGLAIGKSGDGGIDGVIKEDELGLDNIYIQAKRWEGNVGSPEIQQFAGALDGQGALKGVFITTSDYTKAALGFLEKMNNTKKIILINGYQLAKYMIKYGVGVYTKETYEVKGIDSDYFEEV